MKIQNLIVDYLMTSKRLFDLSLAIVVSIILAIPLILIWLAIRLTSSGPALYWSDRIGKNNQIFRMPKFRSMRIGTPEVAPHLLINPYDHITPIGVLLRKSSLDELPQLWSILKGDMSFVGPRPALFNEEELTKLRTAHNVHKLMPGLTGWAQINGRNQLLMAEKVAYDAEYLNKQSIKMDIYILFITFIKVISRDGISH